MTAKVEREHVEEAGGAPKRESLRRRLMLLEKRLRRKRSILGKIDVDEITRLIREDREAR